MAAGPCCRKMAAIGSTARVSNNHLEFAITVYTSSAATEAENCLRHCRNSSSIQPLGIGRVVRRVAAKSMGVCDASWMAL